LATTICPCIYIVADAILGIRSKSILPEQQFTRTHHLGYALDFAPLGFSLFGHPKEEMKKGVVTSQDDLDDKLTDLGEHANGHFLRLMIHEWIVKLAEGMEYEADYYHNSHEVNKNRICSSQPWQCIIILIDLRAC
jgi:hypothetical protein